MSTEIERKFLVNSDAYKREAEGVYYRQNYLSNNESGVVRVRIAGDKGYLTIKGKSVGISRSEFEYEIPLDDAEVMLDNLCTLPEIEKVRYRVSFGGFVWEVDEFSGKNEGLVVAEIELPTEDTVFEKPDWVGEEVSDDARYYNSNLLNHPFK
ncbi:MAG: CYTH domain-containing protein [Bacteroidales bacterium]|nr:CYTH domain-containing protein [Bacteroidales bacterium]